MEKTAIMQAIDAIEALQIKYPHGSVRWYAYQDTLDILTGTSLPIEREGIEQAGTISILSAIVQLLGTERDATVAYEIFTAHSLSVEKIEKAGATKEDIDLIKKKFFL